MRPELPYLTAGTIAIIGGMAREHSWPEEGHRAVLATLIMVVIASATSGTSIAPLVRAIGLLAVLGAVMKTVPVISKAQVKGK